MRHLYWGGGVGRSVHYLAIDDCHGRQSRYVTLLVSMNLCFCL